MDKVDQEYMEEIMKSTDGSGNPRGSKEIVSVKDDGTTLEDIEVSRSYVYYGWKVSRRYVYYGWKVSRRYVYYGWKVSRSYVYYGWKVSQVCMMLSGLFIIVN